MPQGIIAAGAVLALAGIGAIGRYSIIEHLHADPFENCDCAHGRWCPLFSEYEPLGWIEHIEALVRCRTRRSCKHWASETDCCPVIRHIPRWMPPPQFIGEDSVVDRGDGLFYSPVHNNTLPGVANKAFDDVAYVVTAASSAPARATKHVGPRKGRSPRLHTGEM